MNVHMTEIETGTRITLSMLPEKPKLGGSTAFQDYNIINVGTVRIPNGTELMEFSWDGMLPGPSRKKASYVKKQYWESPGKIIATWDKWRREGTRINLMITETPINYDVYLSDYSAEPYGGYGDYDYDISFIEAKSIKVYTAAELKKLAKKKKKTASRPESKKAAEKSYKVVPGDSLWKIAQKKLHKGNRWPEIYELNKDKIKDKDELAIGQNLTLPA